MKREFPEHSIHQARCLAIPGANILAIKWFTVLGKHVGGIAGGVASFELMTYEGETVKLVDDMGNGWMAKRTHVSNLMDELDVLIDELVDFRVEVRALLVLPTREEIQLELF